MTSLNEYARKKAELLINNKIYIPKEIKIPYPLDRSTAGPGSGSLSVAISFDNKNIKLSVSKNQNVSFSLQKENGKFKILQNGKIFIENVEIIPTLFHAPKQTFINLEGRCIYNCAFCNLSKERFT